MKHQQRAVTADRLNTLERRIRRYRCMVLGCGLILVVLACLAAQHATSKPVTIRAARLEIVNASGQIIVAADSDTDGSGMLRLWTRDGMPRFGVYATSKGGRLEVFNHAGYELFSAGPQRATGHQGLWEQQRHRFDQSTQTTERLNQEMRTVENRLRSLDQPNRADLSGTQQQRDIDRLQAEIDRQRRELDRQRSMLTRLEQQVNRIDRR